MKGIHVDAGVGLVEGSNKFGAVTVQILQKVTASSFQVTLCSENVCMITVLMGQRSSAKCTGALYHGKGRRKK